MLLNLRLGLQIVFLFLHLISRWVFFLSFFLFFFEGRANFGINSYHLFKFLTPSGVYELNV